MKQPSKSNRKIKFAYFASALLSLGLVLPILVPAALPAYITFVSGITGLAGLVFGANVLQKIGTKEAYIKELEIGHKEE